MNTFDWNPYFAAFAKARGTTPEETPAGVEFIVWIMDRWTEWAEETGVPRDEWYAYDTVFAEWLEKR